MADTAAAAPVASSAPADASQSTDSGEQPQQLKSDVPQKDGTKSGTTQKDTQKSPTPSMIRKMKVDGQDFEVNLFDDKQLEQLLRDAGLGKAAFHRMREAAELKKTADSRLAEYEKDPLASLKNPKLTKEQRREIIEKYYQEEYIASDSLTPEQKELLELKKWKQDKEDGEKRDSEKKTNDEMTAKQKQLEAQWEKTYHKQIIEVLEKGGLAKKPRLAARIAAFMFHAKESGFDAPLETIAAEVKKDIAEDISVACADDVPIEQVLQILPPSLVQRIRKYDLDQYKARQAKVGQPAGEDGKESTPRKKREERPSYAEVLKKFGS